MIASIDASALVFGDSSGGALAIEAAADGGLVVAGRAGDAVERFLALMGTPPATIAQMKTDAHWSHMAAFAAPLLALAGSQSAWAIPAADAVADAVANGSARILPAQGHAVDDAALIPALREFFS